MRPLRFADAHVIVTGASRGLGRAIAVAFGAEGARVGVTYRTREADAQETVELVREAGGQAVPLRMDVRDGTSVQETLRTFAPEGAVDVLVNNAAVVRDSPFVTLSAEEWSAVLDTNLSGTYRCCRAVAPGMMARRRGAIVNVGSVAALRASPAQANYSAAKAGVLGLTRTLAAELAPYEVRVNAVVPGLLRTGMGARLDHRVAERRRQDIPLGRFGEGAEVARSVLFLASDEGSYVVGQCLTVDGGLSI